MTHVLVTGAGGFLGRATLAPLVERGWQVTAVGRRAPAGVPEGVRALALDLADGTQVRACIDRLRPTHLLHLAWYTEHGKYWAARENLGWVAASLALVQAFRERGGQRVVAAGTCAEYDWAHGFCNEVTTPLVPRSLYGTCKNALRSMLEAGVRDGCMSFAWGRVFFPYGPGEGAARLVPSVLRAIRDGRPVLCSHGRQYRDFLHVDDVADAFCTLLDCEGADGAFNIASGEPVRIRDIVEMIKAVTGWSGTPEFGAVPVPVDDPPLLVGDNDRLVRLGWSPRVGLEQGLRDAMAWWHSPTHSFTPQLP